MITLAVPDYVTLKSRDRDVVDMSYRARDAAPLAHVSSKGKELKAPEIRGKPPAIRRRRQDLSHVERSCPNSK